MWASACVCALCYCGFLCSKKKNGEANEKNGFQTIVMQGAGDARLTLYR